MFGAGKRKTRRPTRFADYRFEDDIWSEHAGDRSRSPTGFSQAPSERLEEEIEEQLAEVSRTIERLQLTEARVADRHTSPKSSPPLLPTGPRYDDVSRTSLSRGLGRDDLPTASRPQEELETASRRQGDRGAYPLDYGLPSLYDIRTDRHGKQGARPKYSPPPLPTDDIPTSYPRTLSRELGKDGRGARGTAFPTAARRQEDRGASQFDSGYPSLHDIRAMNYLKDPKTSADRTFRTKKGQPNPRSPHDRKSDVAVQSRFEPSRDYSPDSDDDRPFRGKRKLRSGLSRKSHDKVKREVRWPHEFVFSTTKALGHDDLTWDQFVAGEIAIILHRETDPNESYNRAQILKGAMLDIPTYTFEGVRAFYRTMLQHVEHALLDLDSTHTLADAKALKNDYLRRPDQVATDTPSDKSKTKVSATDTPCSGYQRGTCTFNADHPGPYGSTFKHVCKYCYRFRPDVPLRHTPSECKYADKTKRDAYTASKAPSPYTDAFSNTDFDYTDAPDTTHTQSISKLQDHAQPSPPTSRPADIHTSNIAAICPPVQELVSAQPHRAQPRCFRATATGFPDDSRPASSKSQDQQHDIHATAESRPSCPAHDGLRRQPTRLPGIATCSSSHHAGSGPDLVTAEHTPADNVARSPSASVSSLRPAQALHKKIYDSGDFNFRGLRIPVNSNLNISAWRAALSQYHDAVVADFLEFGWPVGYTAATIPRSTLRNHPSASEHSDAVEDYLEKEIRLGATHGPFFDTPFEHFACSPLQTVSKRDSEKRRVVVDLSFPPGSSVNSGIPAQEYLGDQFTLTLPSYDAFEELLRAKGQGCLMFKRDLSRAYRQIPVDPHDYHLLGYRWRNGYYFDSSFPFGLRSAAMACQRTTNAVSFVYSQQGYSCVNYIDDFGGADTPTRAKEAFRVLGDIFDTLGLEESADKATPPSTQMTFLGVGYDSDKMSKEVTPDRLSDTLSDLKLWTTKKRATKREIQAILGKLSFISACVTPGRVFLSRIITTLKGLRSNHHRARLNSEFRKDIQWWLRFLPAFNGVSLIHDLPGRGLPDVPTTDACLTGCGGTFQQECFHTQFPQEISEQDHPIHRLEMLAVVVACKVWCAAWAGCTINIACDNTVTVYVINSGRSTDTFMQACARELVYLQATNDFRLYAHHIPGVDNRLADFLSRWHTDPSYQTQFQLATDGQAAWRTLQQDTLRTQRSAFAASTQANHKTHFTAYLAFCRFFKKQPLPATAHLLSCYAQFLSRSLRSPASISHYLSSVKLLHQHHGFFDFDLKHFELQQTLKGLKRQLQHRPREHHPVTPEFLLKAHRALDLHNAKDATIWAIILIGFFAYFRKSNLVPSTAKTFNPNRHLCRRDIAVATEGLLLRTSWSKTIQANERELLTPVLAIPGSRLCPVTAYNNMVRLVPATQDSPAFQLPPTPHRHFRPVTSSILEKAFAKLVAAANLPAGYHTLHDLRRGGYTLAFEAGVPRELRQRHGDWRSNADLLYLQPSMEQRLRLPVAMRSLLRRRTT
ncbi:Hypp1851 [Branchiostoma lanceolatum]|uniref:ribonuclease H n=1 Tax=Branchiostoma lanceolatum TaxID=7740 RepID=A0A8J9ZP01_BRALA|nr:Hypp1851 [Branchiostoma lanceolatum]